MVPERDVDCGEIYERTRRDFVVLLKSLGPEEPATRVPATPEWSVRDVLAHVVGITADLNAQEFGTDSDSWTAAQVRSRAHHTIDEMAGEWDREAPAFEEGLRRFGYELGSHFVGDLLQHVGDVRHALGLAAPADDVTLAVALDFYLMSFEETLGSEQLGAVEIHVEADHWTLGPGSTVAFLTADRYALFRSLGGRRTAEQIRALHWSGDTAGILPVVGRYSLPEEAVEEG